VPEKAPEVVAGGENGISTGAFAVAGVPGPWMWALLAFEVRFVNVKL